MLCAKRAKRPGKASCPRFRFESEHHNLMDAYYKSWFVLFSNHMQSDDPRFKYPFTSVNKFHYYNQFFWDSGFHAIP